MWGFVEIPLRRGGAAAMQPRQAAAVDAAADCVRRLDEECVGMGGGGQLTRRRRGHLTSPHLTSPDLT